MYVWAQTGVQTVGLMYLWCVCVCVCEVCVKYVHKLGSANGRSCSGCALGCVPGVGVVCDVCIHCVHVVGMCDVYMPSHDLQP